MKKLAFLMVLLFAVGSATAVKVPDSQGLQDIKKEYNRQSDEVPGFVGNIVGGERVNIRLETDSGNKTVGVSFEGVEISEIKRDGFENPTLRVWSDEKTVSTIMDSDNKYETLQKKLNENEIHYKATTVGSGIKVVIFDTLRGIADLVGISF